MAAISTGTSPLYTAQNPGWNYEAIAYDANELPQPLPARNDLLPWERKERTEQERYAKQATETQRAYDDAARQKARGGFFNNLSASMKPRFAKWRTTPMPVREAIPSKRDERRFNNKFHFPSYERLLFTSELCKTVSGAQQILGKVYVSEHFFCFRESRLQPKGGRRQRLNLVIPIDDVLSIAQAEIMSQPDPRYAPEFRTLDQWHAKADGIFLYTRDMKVHRFFGFWTQQTYHDTFNVLDRQWRTRPYTSTQPLKAGEVPLLSRSMVPPINYASPSVMVLEPAQFQPEPATNLYASRSLSSSVLRTAPPYAAAMPASMRQSFTERPVMDTAEFRPDLAASSYAPSDAFSGKQAQRFQSRSAGLGSRTLPSALLNDIRRANIASLRRVGAPSPRYGHVIADLDNRIQLVPLESYGTAPRAFGVASQGRQFRTPHYLPKQTARSAYQQPPRRFETQEEEAHIPVQLANDIKHYPHQRLHHVNPAYHTAVPLGHVVDQRASASSWQPRQSQQRVGFVPRERLGFQTVQQRLHASQRGRSLPPQLQDEIRFFNLRGLHHVTPVVRQWWPQASDIKMRPAGVQERSAEGHEPRRHRHHHHHKHQRSERGTEAQAPVQVFQYEEYDLASPNKYERVQVTKFQEQLSRKEADLQQQSASFIPTAGGRTFEAGTA